jgi:hypothetical protein
MPVNEALDAKIRHNTVLSASVLNFGDVSDGPPISAMAYISRPAERKELAA